jgi:N-methylhydantoinase B
MNYTHAYTSFAVKCAISPEVPHNEGSFRPVHVTAPPGCILNAQHPAPVAARHLIGHFLPGLIFGALARAMPEGVMADGAASIWITMFRGIRTSDDPYTFMLFQCGGTGARPTKDGLNNVGFPSGVAGVPAEVMESLSGLVVERKEVRPDSGGPGKFRGGCGQYTTFVDRSGKTWSMSGMYDRLKFPANGLLGGRPGTSGEFALEDGRSANPKELIFHAPFARVETALPGGGGYGDPFERDPALVLEDVVNGYVTVEAAARDYGVAVRTTRRPDEQVSLPSHFSIDAAATAELRSANKPAAPAHTLPG